MMNDKPHKGPTHHTAHARQAAGVWAAFLVGAAGIATVVIAITTLRSQERDAPVDTNPIVAVAPLLPEDGYTLSVRNLGRVEAARRSALGFELPGAIAAVTVDVGDRVQAGTLLASLDTLRLEAALTETTALLRAAEANQMQAEAELQRVTMLTDAAVAAQREMDEAVRARDTASAATDAAAAALARIQTDIAKAHLRSPYDGIIVARPRHEGEIVAAGEPVLELIESSRMRIRAGVAPDAAQHWEPGMPVLCELDGRRFDAVIERIVPSRDPATRTWEVVVTLDPPGVYDGDIAFILTERRVDLAGFWLPRHALAESVRGLWGCYVVTTEGDHATAELRPVEILHHEQDRAFVRGALRPGDLLVVDGAQKLVPGMRVNPLLPTTR